MRTTSKQPTKKNNHDVMALIEEWEKNPDWDLETAPGFEDYAETLHNYRIRKQRIWKEEKVKNKIRAAQSMNLTLPFYELWQHNKHLGEMHREKSKKLMLNLVYGTEKVDAELSATVELIIDSIFRGTINLAKAEMLAEKYKYTELCE